MNRKKLIITIFIFTIVLIIGVIIFKNTKKYNSLIVSSNTFESIKEERVESNNIKIENIKFNDYSILIDQENSILYYSMIDTSSKYNPSISYKIGDNTKLAIKEKITKEKVSNNYRFEIMLYDDSKYHIYNLIVTELPIINISYDENITKENKIPIDIYMFDNRNNSHQKALNSKGDMNIIDNGYDKKDYSFSLIMDSPGNKERENNISILGMKKHNEYILNSLYDDQEKIRNVFSINLWDEIINTKEDKNEYVELFINNHYVGLYSLGYNIENEHIMLDKDEFIFFKNELLDVEKKYSKVNKLDGYVLYNKILQNQAKRVTEKRDCEGDGCPKIDPYNELNKYYENLLSNDIDKIKKVSNLDNAVQIYLFYLFTQASNNVDENTFANTYLLFRKNKNNYEVEYIPWDLNYTFGNKLIYNKVNNYYIEPDNNDFIMKYNPITILLELNDQDTKEMIKKEYSKLRKDLLNEEYINNVLDLYEKKIFDSGAFIRDSEKWINSNKVETSKKLTDFREYVINRLKYMDLYIENL